MLYRFSKYQLLTEDPLLKSQLWLCLYGESRIYSHIFNVFHALLQTHVFLQLYIKAIIWFYMFSLESRKKSDQLNTSTWINRIKSLMDLKPT
jgi:hypothetical protein